MQHEINCLKKTVSDLQSKILNAEEISQKRIAQIKECCNEIIKKSEIEYNQKN